ncbi:DinB family protein [Hymenobacter busanensis]|uniref:DinB family protein n=1 Tax=Hymenobacter busanensis TaxID=2607656 RepID=A0A7L4ZZ18_9BACT|nr:DinB family protein [Hymenobacter busanensis]KAA9331336.1 DinB family protein [Hymenobacter busanensis]QHJ08488.1 DinB family protein [Hymenobacter busanensis]
MTTNAFIQQLQAAVRRLQTVVETELQPLSNEALNFKARPDSWSVLECLEHLNRYSRYYNPAFAKALQSVGRPASVADIGYSWLGRKSLDIVRPGNGKPSKTVKHMNPAGSQLGRTVLNEFLLNQRELLRLLDQAAATDLNRKVVPVEFFRLLKLRLGEALEFVVLHETRHVQQAQRAAQLAQATAPVLVV